MRAPGLDEVFDMEQFTRWRLMEGLDDIGLTLRHTEERSRVRGDAALVPADGLTSRLRFLPGEPTLTR